MRSLHLIKKIDKHTLTLLQEEVRINTHLMLRDPFYYENAHQDFTYLWLIRATFPKGKDYSIFREKENILQNSLSFYGDDVMRHFPVLTKVLYDCAEEKKGILARTLITTLYNDKKFFMHIDTGMYYVFADRYCLYMGRSTHSDRWRRGQVVAEASGVLPSTQVASNLISQKHKQRTLWQDARRRFFRNRLAVLGLIIVCFFCLIQSTFVNFDRLSLISDTLQ